VPGEQALPEPQFGEPGIWWVSLISTLRGAIIGFLRKAPSGAGLPGFQPSARLLRGSAAVDREYDLFEQFPDGFPMWRRRAMGLPEVRRQLTDLCGKTKNECFAMYLPTKEIVARVNVGGQGPQIQKRLVAQVVYDPAKGKARTAALRAEGYEVVSAIGNEAAKLVLDLSPSWNLFLIGEGAANGAREEMASWLKERFPRVPILALNPPTALVLEGADYNAVHDDSRWMRLVASVFNRSARPSDGQPPNQERA